jgi:hypothetical protein
VHVRGLTLANLFLAVFVRRPPLLACPLSPTDLVLVQPIDYTTGRRRGFCFVEYKFADDAEEAVFNMDGAELLSKVLRVSLAQPNQVNKLSSSSHQGGSLSTSGRPGGVHQAVWKSDEWFQRQILDAADDAATFASSAAAAAGGVRRDSQDQRDAQALR